jgi:integrase
MSIEAAAGVRGPVPRVKITKRVVDGLRRGQTIWDKDLAGFGVRLQRRDPSFVLKYSFRRHQRYYTIGRYGILTVDEARNEARRLLGLVASGVDPSQTRTIDPLAEAPPTVGQLCVRYLSDGPSFKPDKRESSWTTDRSNIHRHVVPLIGLLPAASVTEADIASFVARVVRGDTRTDERTGPRGRAIVRGGKGTAARSLAVLGAVFSFGVRLGIVPTNPTKNIKAPKGDAPGRFLTEAEWGRLGQALTEARKWAANSEFLDAIQLIALTGCRKSEISNLTWCEVDFNNGFLRLRHSKVGPRAVPLGDEAVSLLARLKEKAGGDWVFASRRGSGPIVALQKAWSALRTKAHLPGLRLHDLRHSYASEAINAGASLFMTGAILGHRQSSTTQKYAHLQSTQVRSIATGTASRIAGRIKSTLDP